MPDFWDVQPDVFESFDLAMRARGISPAARQEILTAVLDSCVNHLGDDAAVPPAHANVRRRTKHKAH